MEYKEIMGKLIDLADRLETWKTVFDGSVNAAVSSRGRFRITSGGTTTYLNMVDSVTLLSSLSQELEAQMSVLFDEEPAPVVKIG